MDHSVQQQTQQLLGQLPPEGLEELARFIEFLQFKYRLTSPPIVPAADLGGSSIPADSLTAQYQGMVQSPLSVAELSELYELNLMGDEDESG